MGSKVKSLAMSFKYAARGVAFCIRNERNMRIHTVFAAYVLIFSVFYDFSKTQYLILILTIGMVFFAEAVNTAVEALVNLETQCYDSLARIAKDVAAGAVLICSAFAVAVGALLFFDLSVIESILLYFEHNMLIGALLLLSLPASALFVFGMPSKPYVLRKKL